MKGKQAILIISCDKYADLWEPFFDQFWKNWPDCPYPVYLGSNKIRFKHKKVTTLLTHDDFDWSTSFKKILSQVKEDFLFVWMEDTFIISKVDNKIFQKAFTFLEKESGNHIHFRPSPKPDHISSNPFFGGYDKGIPYRVNVVGFWRKDYLFNLLLSGENAWNFEIMGSYRASYSNGFYCFTRQIFQYVHMVDKGTWISEGIKYCLENNITILKKKRKELINRNNIISKAKNLYFDTIFNINWRIRLKIINILRKAIVSY